VRAYCQSKLAQIIFTFTLANELEPSSVTATCLHPATYMPTKIVASPVSTLEEGVAATARLAANPALHEVTGRYFSGTRERQADPQAYDLSARRELEEISGALIDVRDRASSRRPSRLFSGRVGARPAARRSSSRASDGRPRRRSASARAACQRCD